MRLIAVARSQLGPVSPIAPVCNDAAQKRTNAYVVDVMSVVLASADGDKSGTKQWCKANQGASQITTTGLVTEDVKLTGEEETQEAQPSKRKGRMARRERSPTVMQEVVSHFSANIDGDQDVGLGSLSRLASGDEVRPGTSNGILDNVGDERCHDDRDAEAEIRGFVLVKRGARGDVIQNQDAEGKEEGIDEVQHNANSLDLGMRVHNAQIIDKEHAVEGLDKYHNSNPACKEDGEPEIVGGVRPPPKPRQPSGHYGWVRRSKPHSPARLVPISQD